MIAAVAASVSVGLAALIGLASAGPVGLLVAALALVQLLVVVRWFGLLEVPVAARGGAFVGAAAAVGADLAVALSDDRRPLAPVTAVLGIAVVAAMAHQLIRRDGRARLTASLTATVTLAVVAALGSCYLGVQASRDGVPFVVAAVVAAAAAAVATAVPGPPLACAAAGLVAGVLGAVLVGLVSDLGAQTGGVVGLGCAVAAALAVAVASRTARPDPFVTASLPLLLVAPVAFLLARLLAA